MATTPLPRIALAGASGRLGAPILTALTSSQFLPSYTSITLLQRPSSKATFPATLPKSVTVRTVDPERDPAGAAAALQDIDVLINAVGSTGHGFKDALARAFAAADSQSSSAGTRLYIPSEFGVDHTCHDFPHVEWDHKKTHFEMTRQLFGGGDAGSEPRTRVLRIYVGLFLEESIGPWFGFHTAKGLYECIGSADVPVSYTSLADAGKVVAQVARMRMVPVLEDMRIGGDTVSTREVAKVMAESAGAGGEIEVRELDLQKFKSEVIAEGTEDPSKYLRFLMGEGKINHTAAGLGNDNEIVNPSETLWKWKTMKDLAAETKGRPWADVPWDDSKVQ